MHARDYQPGERVPGTVYRVVRLIGAGGMGTVYDVEDTTIGKRFVLKTLHPQLGARDDLARRMQNEARTLARLNHPNIVEVFTAGVTADDLRLPFYVMERLNGQSLRLVLEKRGQLELQHAYHIGIDLLDALDHAHDKGVIHRDVKPDNIFLHRTPAGVTLTKLLDFGIVSLLDSGSHETEGRFLGTLRYAAPEQLRGEKASAKTDVYAAGLVLYEILAGRGPFDDEGDPHRVGAAHLHKTPPLISRLAPVPRDLEVLLMASLSKNPVSRPRDAFSFAASLRNLKRNAPSAARDVRSASSRPPASESRASGEARSSVSLAALPTPRPAVQVSTPSTGVPTRLPLQTLPGMFSPTSAASPTHPASSTHAASPAHAATGSVSSLSNAALEARDERSETDGVDRSAATRSDDAPTRRVTTLSETEFLTPSVDGLTLQVDRTQPVYPLPEVRDALSWPAERSGVFSDAPQVRSLVVPVATRFPRAVVLASTLGVAAAVALFAAVRFIPARGGLATVPASHEAARPELASGPSAAPRVGAEPVPPPMPSPPSSETPPSSVESTHGLAVVPSARPPQVVPAPTLAVPSLDAPAPHSAPAWALRAGSASSAAPVRSSAARALPFPKGSAAPARKDAIPGSTALAPSPYPTPSPYGSPAPSVRPVLSRPGLGF